MSGAEDEPRKKRPKLVPDKKEDDKSNQEDKEKLLEELKKLQEKITNILAEAQENAKQSIENFVADKVRKMGAMIGHYFTTFQALNVMSRKEMDEAVRKMYIDESIRDAQEELYHAEDDWNSFLADVDTKINPSSGVEETQLLVGSRGPCELKLTDVSTERQCFVQDLLTSTSTLLILLRHFA